MMHVFSMLLLSCILVQAAPQGDRLSTYAQFFQKRQVKTADLVRRKATSLLTARQSTISPGFCTTPSDCTKPPSGAKATCQAGICVYQCPSFTTINSDKTACDCPAPLVLNAAFTACSQCATASNCPSPPANGASLCTTTGTCGIGV